MLQSILIDIISLHKIFLCVPMNFEKQEITMFYKNQSYKLNERNQNDLIFDPIFTFRQQIHFSANSVNLRYESI